MKHSTKKKKKPKKTNQKKSRQFDNFKNTCSQSTIKIDHLEWS